MTYETIWAWIQAKGRIYKVISNPVDGTIEVRDETGEIILRKTNLSQRQVENVEKRFKRLGMKRIMHRSSMSAEDFFDPMIS